MPLTGPIPESAAPVVRRLREDVSRPKRLPQYMFFGLRWVSKRTTCPMGLHPLSVYGTPGSAENFADGKHSNRAVKAFFCWWDMQTDARAAVNAVWPRKRKKKK